MATQHNWIGRDTLDRYLPEDEVECFKCGALMSELSDGTWSCDECGYQETPDFSEEEI